jgi:transposase
MNGTLYAILEVVVFMIAATLFGFLVGRSGRRRALVTDPDLEYQLVTALDAIRELEEERSALDDELTAAKKEAEEARREAAEVAHAAEVRFEASPPDEDEAMTRLQAELEDVTGKVARLEAQLERRNRRIARLEAARSDRGDAPLPDAGPAGDFSTSAGAFADARIVFAERESGT